MDYQMKYFAGIITKEDIKDLGIEKYLPKDSKYIYVRLNRLTEKELIRFFVKNLLQEIKKQI